MMAPAAWHRRRCEHRRIGCGGTLTRPEDLSPCGKKIGSREIMLSSRLRFARLIGQQACIRDVVSSFAVEYDSTPRNSRKHE